VLQDHRSPFISGRSHGDFGGEGSLSNGFVVVCFINCAQPEGVCFIIIAWLGIRYW